VEYLTRLIEKVMSNKTWATTFGLIALVAPLYFLKTLYVVWFGPYEVFVGFQSEQWTWLVLSLVDFVGFLTTLPAREKGRVIQIVMALWAIEMLLVFVATLVR